MDSENSENTTQVEAHQSAAVRPNEADLAVRIPIGQLQPNPDQPRSFFDEVEHKWLTESIAKEGVLQPILVKPTEDGQFMIIAGERRYRAAQAAGLESIPAVVRSDTDTRPVRDLDVKRMALIENLQRAELNDFELAVGVTEYLRRELQMESLDEVARLLRRMLNKTLRQGEQGTADQVEAMFRQLGRHWVSFTTNQLTVFSLHRELQDQLRLGALDLSKARLLNRVKDVELMRHLMWNAIANKWSSAMLKREIADLSTVRQRTMDGELRRAEIAKRMTATRRAYVKNRRRLPDETLAEIEELMERIDLLVGVEEEGDAEQAAQAA